MHKAKLAPKEEPAIAKITQTKAISHRIYPAFPYRIVVIVVPIELDNLLVAIA